MISFKEIQAAHNRISPFIHRTDIMTSRTLNTLSCAELYFKCENFQRTGSFKIRGATNAVLQLTKRELSRGIITASSGNHGAALSMAVTKVGSTTKVVMPKNTPKVKVLNVERNGGEIIWCDSNQISREQVLKSEIKKTGSVLVHPYNDERIVAGQATVAKEFLEDIPELDAIVSPVSGGGLLAGALCSVDHMNSKIKVYGSEPEEADDAYRSLISGKIQSNKTINTICDGLRAQVGTITFPIIKNKVKSIVRVSEKDIIMATRMIWDRLKIIVEPSCAITLATVLNNKDLFLNKKIGLILSGGNLNLNQLIW